MSHIKRETVTNVSGVSKELLSEGLKIVGAMLEMHGHDVSISEVDMCHLFYTRFKAVGPSILVEKERMRFLAYQKKTGGVAFVASHLSIDDQKLVAPLKEFQSRVEAILPGAVYLAARAQLAKAQGKKVEIRANPETRQLQLAVEV